MTTATLTSKGQTVIPKPVRDVRRLKGILRKPGRKAATIEDMNKAITGRGYRLK